MANRDILRQSFTGSVLKRRGFHIDMVKPRVSWESKKGPHADITRSCVSWERKPLLAEMDRQNVSQ